MSLIRRDKLRLTAASFVLCVVLALILVTAGCTGPAGNQTQTTTPSVTVPAQINQTVANITNETKQVVGNVTNQTVANITNQTKQVVGNVTNQTVANITNQTKQTIANLTK